MKKYQGGRMSAQHAGSCLCGEVRYAVSGDFERFYLCHCSRCRKDTGSAHAANLFSASAKLTWLAGEDAVRTHALPGTRHVRSFCVHCGSALPSVRPDGLLVPAGSLDTELAQRPDGIIFTASSAAWSQDLASVPRHEALPG